MDIMLPVLWDFTVTLMTTPHGTLAKITNVLAARLPRHSWGHGSPIPASTCSPRKGLPYVHSQPPHPQHHSPQPPQLPSTTFPRLKTHRRHLRPQQLRPPAPTLPRYRRPFTPFARRRDPGKRGRTTLVARRRERRCCMTTPRDALTGRHAPRSGATSGSARASDCRRRWGGQWWRRRRRIREGGWPWNEGTLRRRLEALPDPAGRTMRPP